MFSATLPIEWFVHLLSDLTTCKNAALGRAYIGFESHTYTGKVCQRCDSQVRVPLVRECIIFEDFQVTCIKMILEKFVNIRTEEIGVATSNRGLIWCMMVKRLSLVEIKLGKTLILLKYRLKRRWYGNLDVWNPTSICLTECLFRHCITKYHIFSDLVLLVEDLAT